MTPIWPPTYSSYDRCRSQMTRLLGRPPDISLRFPVNHTVSVTECALATGGYFAITHNYGVSWRKLESLVTHIEAHALLDLATMDELGSTFLQDAKTGVCSSSMVWSYAREAFSTWWTLSSDLYRTTCELRPRSASEKPSDYFSEIMNEPLSGPLIDHDYRRAWKMWCRVVKTCSTLNHKQREDLKRRIKKIYMTWQSAVRSIEQADASDDIQGIVSPAGSAPGYSATRRQHLPEDADDVNTYLTKAQVGRLSPAEVDSLRLKGMRLQEELCNFPMLTAHAEIARLKPDAALEQGAWPAMLKVMEEQSREDQARLSGLTAVDPMLLSGSAT